MSDKKYNSFFANNVPQNSVLTEPLPRPKYDFAVAFPDPDHFPIGDLHESLGEALKDQGRDLVFYPHPQGLLEFRELVCKKIKDNRGIDVGPQNVIITAGSGQSINLITQLFINPGDTIVSEQFTYTGALRVFERFGAKRVFGVGTLIESVLALCSPAIAKISLGPYIVLRIIQGLSEVNLPF